MFYLTGDIERYGTGYVRIREYLKSYPEISIAVEEMGNFFKAELRLTPPITPPIGVVMESHLTELEMKLLRLMNAALRTTASAIAKKLDMRRDTVKEYLNRLKTKGLLVREGTPKSGQWLLTETAHMELKENDRR